MPNWVFNSMVIEEIKGKPFVSGSQGIQSKRLRDLVDKITAPHELAKHREGEFTFLNLIEPDPSIWVDYDCGSISTEEMKKNPNNWYDWNLSHWGTKWDASEVALDVDQVAGQPEVLSLRFDTPWSPPEPIISWFVEYCRENGMTMRYHYEEEQGWGGYYTLDENGELTTEEYDIPNCHADYEDRGQTENCRCEWSYPEEWFDDCPGKEEALKKELEKAE